MTTQDDNSKRPDMKLNVPEQLKVLLVDDWEAVTKNNQVRPLIVQSNLVGLTSPCTVGTTAPITKRCRDPERVRAIRASKSK